MTPDHFFCCQAKDELHEDMKETVLGPVYTSISVLVSSRSRSCLVNPEALLVVPALHLL
jgi:hypothetical protein